MGVSIDQWRTCIGLFSGGTVRKCCARSHSSTPFSMLLGSLVMTPLLLFLIGNIGFVGVHWRLTIFRPVCIMMLFKRVLHTLGFPLSLMATSIAFTVLCTLLVIGNIEVNPGPFPCKLCPVIPETIASSVRHQHDHRMNSNFTYYCPSQECNFSTSSFNSMNIHVSMYHRKNKHRACPASCETLQLPQFSCCVPDCSESAESLWEIVQHYYYHLSDKDGKVPVPVPKCPVQDCIRPSSKPFKKKADLQVHMSQSHRNWLNEGCPKKKSKLSSRSDAVHPASSSRPSTSGVNQEEEMDWEDVPESTAGSTENVDPQLLNDQSVLDCIAKFYLKLYGQFFLPYKIIQEISDGLVLLSNITHARIKLLLTEEFKKLQIEEVQINHLLYKIMKADLLYASHSKDIPGPTFTTDFLRKSYFEKNFNFRPPTEVSLDTSSEKTDKKYQYVPVRQTLETVLKDPVIQREIDKSFQSCPARKDGVMSNYTDGEQFQSESHPSREIHVFLFQDGVNPVMNVLGSAKNKFKDLAVYFTIANLNPVLRAKVSSKHLVMLIRESVIKAVGTAKCFHKLKEDLQDLEENGVMYKGENIKVVLEYGLGDNLGQHFIGGFVQSFAGTYCCRFCNVKRKVFKKNPTVTHSLRTRQSHRQCLFRSKLHGRPYQGVKTEPVFGPMKYFHAATHLVPCAAHDIHEGMVNYDLAGIIGSLVKSKWFSYELLNKRIKKFRCVGVDTANKPAFVNTDGKKLGGHAVQNWTLLRILPFIISDKIKDTNNAAWKLYLQLKELCEYLCGPEFSVSDMPFVKDVLLPQYFEQRSKVLSTTTHPIRPKHHFVCHYPELSLKLGPIQSLWTLPYEQMHKMFKNICRLSKNFVNLEYTLATRHQLNLAYLGTGPLFMEESFEIRPKPFSSFLHPELVSRFIHDQNIIEEDWNECEAVFKNGLKYKSNDLLVLSSSCSQLEAGFIRLILTNSISTDFILEIVQPVYHSAYGIYKIPVESTGHLKKVSIESLKHPVPQPLYLQRGVQAFSLKYKLTES